MAAVNRLVTFVDVVNRAVPAENCDARVVGRAVPGDGEPGVAPATAEPSGDDPREMSFSALHMAVLDDCRRLTLLDDRGWVVHGPPDIWNRMRVEEIEADARMVVGPDEPYGNRSQAGMEAGHWEWLAGILRQRGVLIDAEQLSRLPHEVEISERLHRRIISE